MHMDGHAMPENDPNPPQVLGGKPMGRRLSIYVPSKDKNGGPVDDKLWMDQAMEFMTRTFGRCTAMPQLKGTWSDPQSGEELCETVNIVFSYVSDEDLDRHAHEVRGFLLEMGRKTQQAEVGYEHDGIFYAIALAEP